MNGLQFLEDLNRWLLKPREVKISHLAFPDGEKLRSALSVALTSTVATPAFVPPPGISTPDVCRAILELHPAQEGLPRSASHKTLALDVSKRLGRKTVVSGIKRALHVLDAQYPGRGYKNQSKVKAYKNRKK